MTGWWQINGRSRVTRRTRRSGWTSSTSRTGHPRLDLYILLKTLGAVVKREGAY